MSVAAEIGRMQTDRNTIEVKLIELSMTQNADNLDNLAAAMEGIENQGAVSATVQAGDPYTIPMGCHSGSGTVSGVADVLTGKVIVGADGTAVVGTMPNNGEFYKTIDGLTTVSVAIPTGYFSGGTVSPFGEVEEA